MTTLTGVARRHQQTTYVVLQKSLQQEWAFVPRVTPGIGITFQAVEDGLRDTFLPAIFQGAAFQTPGRSITGLPIRQAGFAPPDPIQTVGSNWVVSCVITGHLVAEIRGMDELRSGDRALLMGDVREDIWWQRAEVVETSLGEDRAAASKTDA